VIFSLFKGLLDEVKEITRHTEDEESQDSSDLRDINIKNNMIIQLFTQNSMLGIFQVMASTFLSLIN
jgi:hypothetical protein